MRTQEPPAVPGAPRLPRRVGRCALFAAALAWPLFAAVWLYAPFSDDARTAFTDAAYLPVDAVVALVACAAGTLPAGLDRRTRLAWRLLAAAFAARLCADGSWWWLEVVQHRAPFPSVADAFYLAFVPLVLAGLLAFPVRRRTRSDRIRLWLDIAIVTVGGFMAVWYLVLGPTARDGGGTALEASLSIAYPAGDLVLLFGVATVVVRGLEPGLRAPLHLLMPGVCGYIVADLGFGYASLQGGFTGGSWPDVVFVAADCFFLAAAGRQLASTGPRRRDGRRTMPLALPANPLPYLGVLLGYGLLVWVGRHESPYGLGGLLLAAVVITVLVLARQVTVSRDNERLARRFEEISITDPLTGLANRRRLFEVAEGAFARAVSHGEPLTVVVIDVDRFKQVNDELGHLAGDAVITAVARRVLGAVRAGDHAARYGGDEFVVVMPGLSGEDALPVVERLSAAVRSEPIVTAAGSVRVTLSVGVADVARARPASSLEQLLARADVALYQVKRRGRDGVQLAA